jgi:serine/threonine protein kinase
MNPDKHRIDSIFLAAAEKASADERAAYLDGACGADRALRERVERLLAAQSKVHSFLEAPAPALIATVDQSSVTERPGTVIGPYKLLEQIGEGGFGVVFLAEQTEPVRRKVALKVLKPGMDTRHVVARFEAERQALAIMDHPNIAKVFDGGATPSGRPYFVMELVKGVPITEFCDHNHLTPRERLELFLPVCQAVQHAHQKGIIHRDLKPSNVLVSRHDTTPVVKVIDFGVAKALGQELTDKTLFTGIAQMVGTPLYMSPEQAGMSDLDIDTRSDIYSLGVLLYELLTGMTPFDKERLKAAGYDELRRIIREEEPPRPSTRISTLGQAATTIAAQRRNDPKRLGQLFRGELDWMVMKALEKDRNRRYESASALAADVERYLRDEPVQACPPSAWYRCRKFLRRNRKAVLATTALLAMAGLFLGLITWRELDRMAAENDQVLAEAARLQEAHTKVEHQRQRAVSNLRGALEILDDFHLGFVQKHIEGDPAREEEYNALLKKALVFYEQFARENATEPSLRYETARAFGRTGAIKSALGRFEEAEKDYEEAIKRLENLDAELPGTVEYQATLAECHDGLCMVCRDFDNYPKAEKHIRRAIQLRENLVQKLDRVEDQAWLAHGYYLLALLWQKTQPPLESVKWFQKAIDIEEEMVKRQPDEKRHWRALGLFYNGLGLPFLSSRQFDEAEKAFRQAIGYQEKVLKQVPGAPFCIFELSVAYGNLATAIAAKDPAKSEKYYRQALKNTTYLVERFPKVPDYQYGLSLTGSRLGLLLKDRNQLDEAETVLLRAREVGTALVKNYSQVPLYENQLGNVLGNLALVLAKRGKHQEACTLLEEAITHQRVALKANLRHTTYRYDLFQDLSALITSLLALKKYEEADAWCRELVGVARGRLEDSPKDASVRYDLATTYQNWALALWQLGKYPQACEAILQGVPVYQGLMSEFPQVDNYRQQLGTSYGRLVRMLAIAPDVANLDTGRAFEFAQKACELEPADAAHQTSLGMAHYRAGNWNAAVMALEKGAKSPKGYTCDGLFFLAMATWRLGNKERAYAMYDVAVRGMADNESHPDLRRCRAEAAALLGVIVTENEPATPILPGQLVKGKLAPEDQTESFILTRKSHRKVHVADLEAGQSYLIDLKGDFNTFLRVEDSKKKPLLYNDDVCPLDPDGLDSRIVFTPSKKGAYRIIATSIKAGATGSYSLQIREAVPVGKPDVRKGQLTKTDPTVKDRFVAEHKVKLLGGCPYTIELESEEFKTYLFLLDPTGKKVVTRNDGIAPGKTQLSRIDFTPKADDSFILAVTTLRPAETGSYTLTIRRYEEAKPEANAK